MLQWIPKTWRTVHDATNKERIYVRMFGFNELQGRRSIFRMGGGGDKSKEDFKIFGAIKL